MGKKEAIIAPVYTVERDHWWEKFKTPESMIREYRGRMPKDVLLWALNLQFKITKEQMYKLIQEMPVEERKTKKEIKEEKASKFKKKVNKKRQAPIGDVFE